ncbi:MAG: diguanylate cyclase, partial [Planctomycetota bacterium]
SFIRAPTAFEGCADSLLKDLWLESRFLAVANDPVFGQTGKVNRLDDAVSRFSPAWINEKMVSLALCRHFIEHEFGTCLDRKIFCVHSLATAQVMREIGRLMDIREQQTGEVYLLGLLHDLGTIFLDSMAGQDYEKALNLAKKGATLLSAERKVFSMTSQKVWTHAIRAWALPRGLLRAYKGVVSGEEASSKMRALIGTSSRIAEMLGANLIKGFVDRSPFEKSDILPLLTGDNLLQISETVRREMSAYCNALDLPHLDFDKLVYSLFDTAHSLSHSNVKRAKAQKELALKVKTLETLGFIFTRIMRSLEGDSLTFSVLESFMAGFSCDCAFMLNSGPRGSFNGYMAKIEDDDQSWVQVLNLPEEEVSPAMKESIERRKVMKIEDLSQQEGKLSFLGDVSEVWLAPACMGDNLRALIGVGFSQKRPNKLDDQFDDLLGLLAAEIGLSVENVRLYKLVCKEAQTDYLTELDNRRNILQVLHTEFARFKRRSTPLSVAIIDLDYFKTINDNLGHLAGDMVLMKIAEILKNGLRDTDYAGRYGGDEFIAVFPHTDLKVAVEIVERIRLEVAAFNFDYQLPDEENSLSVSIGIATAESPMSRFDDLLNAADSALYKAKNAGRNCCLYK